MKIKLHDGSVIELNRIIGLSEDGEVFEGYDNRLAIEHHPVTGANVEKISPLTRIAIAQVMIQRWVKYYGEAEADRQLEAARAVMGKRPGLLGKLAKE